ncbi:MAG: sugar phosphate isomerase/epimerase family protein [Opitutaceae bacterium]|nr:sugar phosphate isomerase/epimerase family protein [Opitutaceae bacterium]
MNRRHFISSVAGATGVALTAGAAPGEPTKKTPAKRYQRGVSPWPISLDTSTIRPASLRDKVRIAAKAGYDAIEPWEWDLAPFEQQGGDLRELGREIRDLGLTVPSVIGLWNAIPETREAWEASLEATRNRMRMAAAIGAQHIQVVPGPRHQIVDLKWAAARYRDLLEIGINEFNLIPAMVFLKLWKLPVRLGEAAAIALDADHPKAKIIPDVYHMHIGGSGFHSLKHIRGDFIAIFQFNDAPNTPSIDQLTDEHRIYPGDGILPLTQCLRDLHAIDYRGCISLELYNPNYWKEDLQQVAETGLRKTLAVIHAAVGSVEKENAP